MRQTHSVSLMAKAYALAMGEPEKTRALYIAMRADQLKEEFVNNERLARIKLRIQKAANEEDRRKKAQAAAAEAKLKKKAERARVKEEYLAKRKLEENEAQRIADAMRNKDYSKTGLPSARAENNLQTASADSLTKAQHKGLMSMEELDKIVESLKNASQKNSFF